MSAEAVIDLLALLTAVVIAVGTTYLAYSALVFTAKPRLHVSAEPVKFQCAVGETLTVDLWIRNVGNWYARPAATEMTAYVNFDESIVPIGASVGLNLEVDDFHIDKVTRLGKGRVEGRRSRYITVRGVNVVYGENSERIRVEFEAPEAEGAYGGWLVLVAKEGDCGLHEFELQLSHP